MSELTKLTASEMRTGLLERTFSSRELVGAHLEKIKASNERYNSFISIREEGALEDASIADEVLGKEGAQSAPLTGIPLALKDNIVSERVETTCGSKILKGFIPPYDSTVSRKLKEAGSILLGKTNLDEFGMGSSSENSAFGPVRNPHDESRVAGGSSGGSAAAVASGQAPIAFGTDTGGSVRQPASLTGIYGLKPTYGRISRSGLVAYVSSCDQAGPMARDLKDVALLLQTVAGKDELDSTSMDVEVPDYVSELEASSGKGLQGLRIGKPTEYFGEGISDAVLSSTEEAFEKLRGLGAEIVDISLPHTKFALPVYYIIAPAEASSNLSRYDGVRYGYRAEDFKNLEEMYAKSRGEAFGKEVQRRIIIGTYVLSSGYYDAYYRKAQQVRTLVINDFKAVFANDCDIIVTPTAPSTAFEIGEKSSPLEMYQSDVFTVPASLAGLPGLSMPCGSDSAKLPIGLQLIGKPFAESLLLKTAANLAPELEFDVKGGIR